MTAEPPSPLRAVNAVMTLPSPAPPDPLRWFLPTFETPTSPKEEPADAFDDDDAGDDAVDEGGRGRFRDLFRWSFRAKGLYRCIVMLAGKRVYAAAISGSRGILFSTLFETVPHDRTIAVRP